MKISNITYIKKQSIYHFIGQGYNLNYDHINSLGLGRVVAMGIERHW